MPNFRDFVELIGMVIDLAGVSAIAAMPRGIDGTGRNGRVGEVAHPGAGEPTLGEDLPRRRHQLVARGLATGGERLHRT